MQIKKYKKLPSTQIFIKNLKNPKSWLTVVAEKQTTGYGRKGAIWYSPEGGLYFSVILPKSQIEDLQTLTILAAFIVAKVIKENFNLEPLIKLPNDVLIGSKKVCGILTENIVGKEIKLSVMGVGLNTNIEKFPKELGDLATSLKMELGRRVDNEKILKQIVKGLREQFKTISQ